MSSTLKKRSSYSCSDDGDCQIYKYFKKNKTLHLRITDDVLNLIRNAAEEESITIASFVRKAVDRYLLKDINIDAQIISDINRLNEQISLMRAENVLLSKQIESLTYSFFVAHGKDCEWEFVSSEDARNTDGDTFYKAEAVKSLADRLFALWKQKILQSEDLRPTLTEMTVKSINVLGGCKDGI